MASGRIDYYTGVDVTYQTLAEVINRPKYGGALLAGGLLEVTANQANTLVGIDGKGMIYGGAVWLDYTNTQANGSVRILTDDITLNDLTFLQMNDYNILHPRKSVITLNKYDPVNFIYGVGVSYGITFETTVELSYTEANGTTPTVHYRLYYALI